MMFALHSPSISCGIRVVCNLMRPGVVPHVVNGCRKLSTDTPSVWLNKDNASSILEKYDNFLLDCDGVLWNADHFNKFPGTPKTMSKLKALGKRFKFVTNNSIPSRNALMEKFRTLGGFEADVSEVFSVACVAGLYLKDVAKIQGKCYLMGSLGMRDEFDSLGLQHLGYGPDLDVVSDHPSVLLNQHFEDNVEAVVLGFDIHFNYNKLFKAASYLSNSKCHYVATNDAEMRIMLDDYRQQPLTGVLVKALNAAANREPVVIGKPHKLLMECVQAADPGMDLTRTVMVGDSMKTDTLFAENSGIDSILVLSGATTKEGLARQDFTKPTVAKPTYVLDSFADLHELID